MSGLEHFRFRRNHTKEHALRCTRPSLHKFYWFREGRNCSSTRANARKRVIRTLKENLLRVQLFDTGEAKVAGEHDGRRE